MRSVIMDLEDRNYSIGRLLDHLDEISEMRGKVDVTVVLKSSVFIALYNNIEATVYAVFEAVHDALSDCQYEELSQSLKVKLLRYSFGRTAGAFMLDSLKVSEEIDKLKASCQTFPGLSSFLRRQSLFSGNVDARKLNVIGISYGMPKLSFIKEDAERMLWVKNKRNKIAHGEQSMSDGGQGIKTTDLRKAFVSVGVILHGFISAANTFVVSTQLERSMRTS